MLDSLWYKIINDLWSNKARTILVVLSIAVGIAGIGLSMHTHLVVANALDQTYISANPAHLTFYTDPYDDDFLQVIRGMKEVRAAEGRHSLQARIQTGTQEWRNITLYAISDYEDVQINILWSEQGVWPPEKQEVLIERASLALLRTEVGGNIQLETPDGKRKRQLNIVGAVYDPNQPPAAMINMAFGYISFDTLEWIGEHRYYNELHLTVTGDHLDKEHLQYVANRVQDKIELNGLTVYSTTIPTPGKHPFDESFQPVAYILEAISLLTLVLSGFLVINTIMALLTQQVQQIGVMKAIGARNGQIINLYLTMVVVLGILALLVAVPAGIGGAFASIGALANFVNINIYDYTLPLWVLLIELALGLVVPLVAALYPVLAGTRVTVREALGSKGLTQSKVGKSFLDRILGRVGLSSSKVLARPLLLSIRNTFRSPGRLVLTIITLTMGGAIFMGIISVRASLIHTFEEVFTYWRYDVGVVLRDVYRSDRLVNEVSRIPGVASVESWLASGARIVYSDRVESNNFRVYAVPPETDMIQPILLEGRWLAPEDTNALVINSDILKEEPDLQVGKDIVLKVKGRETTWKIVGVVKGVLQGPLAYAPYDHFTHITRLAGRANVLQISTQEHSSVFQAGVAQKLEESLKQSGLPINTLITTADERSRAALQINFIVAFLLLVAVLLGVVGGMGLMGAMGINVIERTREIGVLRSIGASDGEVLRIFITEGVFIGILSWFIGALLALPLGMVLSDQLGLAIMRVPLVYIFSIEGVLLWLGLVIVIASLASYLPARSASKLTVREVLAYE